MPVDVEKKVVVVGLGYIGLPTAALIARSGCKVLGIDVNASIVDTINSGRIHIEEVDLDGLVQGVVQRGTLRASLTVETADTFVIAVPTPLSACLLARRAAVRLSAMYRQPDCKLRQTCRSTRISRFWSRC